MAFTEKRLAGPTALTANTETNLYVCPTAQTTTTLIKQVLVTNTGSATTFDLSLVPLGGTAGTANRLFSALALSANETVLLDVSQVMSSGDFISAKSGAGSTVNVTISGVENSGLMVISGLADSAVTTAKIADGNITVEKLGPDIFADIFQSNVVTSTTRPATPFQGQQIYETDTNINQQYDGANWGPTYPGSGFRNKIINGDFRINQRAFTSSTTSGIYGFDRWQHEYSGGTGTYSAQSFTVGSPVIQGYESSQFARLVSSGQSAVSDYYLLAQKIEDVRNGDGCTLTVSFYAKTTSGTPSVAVEFEQNFGSGGSTRVLNYVGKTALTTSWTRYSFQITLPSITGKTIGTSSFLALNFWVSAGSNFNGRTGSLGIQSNTFDFWGVQVEQNFQSTPFEQRPIGVELALCQRYFWRHTSRTNDANITTGLIYTGNLVLAPIFFPVPARTNAPTVTASSNTALEIVYGTGVFGSTNIAFGDSSNYTAQAAITISGGTPGQAGLIRAAASTDYIQMSDEL